MASSGMVKSEIVGIVVLAWTLLLISTIPGQDACWQLERHVSQRCDVNPAWDSNAPLEIPLERTAAESVKSLRDTLCKTASQISKGFILGETAGDSVRFDPFSSIDVVALANVAFDETTQQRDSYWKYYQDCDHWNVVFADHFTLPVDRTVDAINSGTRSLAKSLANTWKRYKHQLRELEFQFVEGFDQMANRGLAYLDLDTLAIESIDQGVADSEISTLMIAKQLLQQHPVIMTVSKLNLQASRSFEKLITTWRDTRAGLLWISSELTPGNFMHQFTH